MNHTKVKEGVRRMRFEKILNRYEKRELTTLEASEILGTSQRNFLRQRIRYQEEGAAGLRDRRFKKRAHNRAEDSVARKMTKLYEERYRGFNIKHFHEFAQREHSLKFGYTWCKNTLEKAGLVKKSKRGGPHRQRRPRKPMAGMMLHQDASTHLWIPFLGQNIDLIVT